MRSIKFYTQNAKVTGSAFQAYLNEKYGSINMSVTKQASFDSEKKRGSFYSNFGKPEAEVRFKLSLEEAARLADLLSRRQPFPKTEDGKSTNLFHSFKGVNSTFSIGEAKVYKGVEYQPLFFAKTGDGKEVKINHSLPEGNRELLVIWLQEAIKQVLHLPYPEKDGESSSSGNKEQASPSTATPEGPDDDEVPF